MLMKVYQKALSFLLNVSDVNTSVYMVNSFKQQRMKTWALTNFPLFILTNYFPLNGSNIKAVHVQAL